MSESASRRIAATFQSGRDPDQDQVVAWLHTLPMRNGAVERSVMKYHLLRALLLYIQSGSGNIPTSIAGGVRQVSAPVVPVQPVSVVTKTPAQVTQSAASVPSSPVVSDVTTPPQASSSSPGKGGSLLRRKIASSMQGGNK